MIRRFATRRFISMAVSAALVVGGAAAVTPPIALAAPAQSKASATQVNVQSRPDLVSARIAAAAQKSRVEVTGLDDEFSTTYVNPDGTETTDTSQTPLRVMQDSAWVPVDYTLQHVDGTWQPTASPVPVAFSDGADADAADIGDGAKEVDLSWDVTLPKPTIDGASATYDLGGGESLVLTATSTGFEQSLVLQQAPTSLPHIKLPLDTSDLTMSSDGNGGFVFQNANGDDVYQMPGPVMYGTGRDPATGEPTESHVVSANLVSTANGPQLDLTPSLAWLQDPSTTYPVTIDPSINSVGRDGDTFIQDNITTSQSSAIYLHAGELAGHASRSFLMFSGVSVLSGKDVTSATLKLWNNGANNCTAGTMHAYALTSTFAYTNTWSDPKPTRTTTDGASASFANGVGSCPNAEVDLGVKAMVQDWANGQTNDGLQLSGTETAGSQGWTFCSMNPNTTGGTACETGLNHQPVLSVTYNSIPGNAGSRTSLPCASACSSARRTDTTRPTLATGATDADGGTLEYDFQIYNDSSGSPGTTLIASGSATGVTAGQSGSWTVPASKLNDGTLYWWRARAYDGTDYGPWDNYISLGVDTTAPVTPTVTSSNFTSGSWTTTASGTINWSSASSDVVNYHYTLDGASPVTTTATSKSFTFSTNALHVLQIQALDAAGNASGTATFTVGEGAGAMTSPTDGTSTQKQVLLTAAAPAGDYVEYQYEQGTTGNWMALPLTDSSNSLLIKGETSGAAPTNWPWTPAATSDTSQTASSGTNWLWNANAALGSESGVIEVRACFSTSPAGSSPTCQSTFATVTLSTGAFDDSSTTQQIGPGELSSVTGDFSVTATDADISAYDGELTVSRSLTTLDPAAASAAAAGVFGPGWTSSLQGPDAGDAGLTPNLASDKSSIDFTDSTGSNVSTYTAATALTGNMVNYTGTGSAVDGSSVSYYTPAACPRADSKACITLTYPGEATTTWSQPTGGQTWVPSSVTDIPSDSGDTTSSYYYDTTTGLPTMIVAAAPVDVNCSQANALTTKGCRSLSFSYTHPVVNNVAVTRLASIGFTAWNPATASMPTTPVLIARYDYDSAGRLADAWDPRITPALTTSYTYNGRNQLLTLTPPGLNAWHLTYDSSNRVQTVSRMDPSGTNATTTIVYDVPISGPTVPSAPDNTTVTLNLAETALWGQNADLPSTGVAVFPATHIPTADKNGNVTPATVSSSDWPWASITYMDYLGQDVDDVSWGAGAWQIGATEYDDNGNLIWSLTSGNVAQALHPTSDTDPYVSSISDTATRGNLLATVNTYDAEGDVVDEQGPMHPVVISAGVNAGNTIDARAHSVFGYDSGSPGGNYYGLQTSDSESAVDITGTDYDTQTTKMSYAALVSGDVSGWTVGKPTATTDPGGLVTSDHYNAAGQLMSEQLPSDSGNSGSRITDTNYYNASTGGSCGNAAFYGLVCTTGPHAQPSSGKPLPVNSYIYDMYDNPTIKTESYGSGSSQTTRVTATTYDGAERESSTSVSATSSDAGISVLPTNFSYNSVNGLLSTESTGTGTSQQTLDVQFNSIAEKIKYTDANQTQSSMSYDLSGRMTSLYDGYGTTHYSYDTPDEHRGLPTSEDIGATGSLSQFDFIYNSSSQLISEKFPNGVRATAQYDNVEEQTGLQYLSNNATMLGFSDHYNSLGEPALQTSPQSSQVFGYDSSSRLTSVQDALSGGCQTRVYNYDNEGNRTDLDTYPSDMDGACSTNSTPQVLHSTFDQADRLTTNGYSYDSLGRAVTIPSSDLSQGSNTSDVTLSFFTNDLVASETQGAQKESFTLDPEESRIASITTNSSTSVLHFSGGGDSPSVISSGPSEWQRFVSCAGAELCASVDQDNSVTLVLENMQGDVVATMTDQATAVLNGYWEETEYGQPRSASSWSAPYAWMGGYERSNDGFGGLMLMGLRVYNPNTGTFESRDPITGGCANSYAYGFDNPVTVSDLSGAEACRNGSNKTLPYAHFKVYHDRGNWAERARLTDAAQALDPFNVIIKGNILYGHGVDTEGSGITNKPFKPFSAHGRLSSDPPVGSELRFHIVVEFDWITYDDDGTFVEHHTKINWHYDCRVT